MFVSFDGIVLRLGPSLFHLTQYISVWCITLLKGGGSFNLYFQRIVSPDNFAKADVRESKSISISFTFNWGIWCLASQVPL